MKNYRSFSIDDIMKGSKTRRKSNKIKNAESRYTAKAAREATKRLGTKKERKDRIVGFSPERMSGDTPRSNPIKTNYIKDNYRYVGGIEKLKKQQVDISDYLDEMDEIRDKQILSAMQPPESSIKNDMGSEFSSNEVLINRLRQVPSASSHLHKVLETDAGGGLRRELEEAGFDIGYMHRQLETSSDSGAFNPLTGEFDDTVGIGGFGGNLSELGGVFVDEDSVGNNTNPYIGSSAEKPRDTMSRLLWNAVRGNNDVLDDDTNAGMLEFSESLSENELANIKKLKNYDKYKDLTNQEIQKIWVDKANTKLFNDYGIDYSESKLLRGEVKRREKEVELESRFIKFNKDKKIAKKQRETAISRGWSVTDEGFTRPKSKTSVRNPRGATSQGSATIVPKTKAKTYEWKNGGLTEGRQKWATKMGYDFDSEGWTKPSTMYDPNSEYLKGIKKKFYEDEYSNSRDELARGKSFSELTFVPYMSETDGVDSSYSTYRSDSFKKADFSLENEVTGERRVSNLPEEIPLLELNPTSSMPLPTQQDWMERNILPPTPESSDREPLQSNTSTSVEQSIAKREAAAKARRASLNKPATTTPENSKQSVNKPVDTSNSIPASNSEGVVEWDTRAQGRFPNITGSGLSAALGSNPYMTQDAWAGKAGLRDSGMIGSRNTSNEDTKRGDRREQSILEEYQMSNPELNVSPNDKLFYHKDTPEIGAIPDAFATDKSGNRITVEAKSVKKFREPDFYKNQAMAEMIATGTRRTDVIQERFDEYSGEYKYKTSSFHYDEDYIKNNKEDIDKALRKRKDASNMSEQYIRDMTGIEGSDKSIRKRVSEAVEAEKEYQDRLKKKQDAEEIFGEVGAKKLLKEPTSEIKKFTKGLKGAIPIIGRFAKTLSTVGGLGISEANSASSAGLSKDDYVALKSSLKSLNIGDAAAEEMLSKSGKIINSTLSNSSMVGSITSKMGQAAARTGADFDMEAWNKAVLGANQKDILRQAVKFAISNKGNARAQTAVLDVLGLGDMANAQNLEKWDGDTRKSNRSTRPQELGGAIGKGADAIKSLVLERDTELANKEITESVISLDSATGGWLKRHADTTQQTNDWLEQVYDNGKKFIKSMFSDSNDTKAMSNAVKGSQSLTKQEVKVNIEVKAEGRKVETINDGNSSYDVGIY